MIRVSPAEAYRLWAPTYDTGPNPMLALEERVLLPELSRLARGLVVDVGCGTGRWGRVLAGAPYLGVDASEAMLQRAVGSVVLGDARRLPLASGVAGLTLCSFAIGYFADLRGAFAEMARITRPGGAIAVSEVHPGPGWSRSFRVDGELYEIEHHAYAADEILAAAQRVGLALTSEEAARFSQAERPLFQAAGREDLFERAVAAPAIWSAIWRRR